MIRVIHCKKEEHGPNYVYIGRPSKWGNPFVVGKDGDRERVIKKYRDWITKGEGQHLLKDLAELKDKRLGCWCKPNPCHGDVLAELCEGERSQKDRREILSCSGFHSAKLSGSEAFI